MKKIIEISSKEHELCKYFLQDSAWLLWHVDTILFLIIHLNIDIIYLLLLFYFFRNFFLNSSFFDLSFSLFSPFFNSFHYNICPLRGQFNSNSFEYWNYYSILVAEGLICDESICKSTRGRIFFLLLHGLSLAILISTKDLVPSERLRRITLHTNHRKEFLQRGANRELAFFHAPIRFNYFYLATIPILHETLQKLVKFQDFR